MNTSNSNLANRINALASMVERLAGFENFDARLRLCKASLPSSLEELEAFIKQLTNMIRQGKNTDSRLLTAFDVVIAAPELVAQATGGKPLDAATKVGNWVISCFPEEIRNCYLTYMLSGKQFEMSMLEELFILEVLQEVLCTSVYYWYDKRVAI